MKIPGEKGKQSNTQLRGGSKLIGKGPYPRVIDPTDDPFREGKKVVNKHEHQGDAFDCSGNVPGKIVIFHEERSVSCI